MNQTDFEIEYNKLNKAQKDAVDSIYWPIMIVAWPWTGKTQIIWLRTANIILKTWINPENILITTFTEAWVVAIKKRLVKFLWNDGYKVTVSTIHSFAWDVISSFPEKFIEYKASILIDEVEGLEVLKNIIDELAEEKKLEALVSSFDKYLYLKEIKDRISKLKQEWVNYKKFEQIIENQKQEYVEELSEIKPTLKKYETTKSTQEKHIKKLEELNIIFEKYNDYLRENSLYDFNDMINFVLEKFESDKDLRLYYAEIFQFIMLDEYQDTNNAQNKIIELILSENKEQKNVLVVWDDDQSIFRFQWANIENMLDFSSKFPDTKIIVLEENYRSNQKILDLATILIDNNEERLSKKITSIKKNLKASWDLKFSQINPKLFKASSELEEQTFVVNEIKTLLKNWYKQEEIAIIVKHNREVEVWSNLLQKNWIEVESKMKTNILNSPYVKYILDYLEIINNPYANEQKLLNVLRSEITWLYSLDVLNINRFLWQKNYVRKIKLKIFNVLQSEDDLSEIWLKDRKSLEDFLKQILELRTISSQDSFSEFFAKFLQKTGILEYIDIHWNFEDIEDIYTLFNKIKDINKTNKALDTEQLLKKVSLYKEYNIQIPRQILTEKKWWVQILTAHSSKWLEYNSVFIPWTYIWNWDGKTVRNMLKLPAWVVWDGIQDLNISNSEEDRRLFFVALTRAKDNLFFSYPAWSWTKVFLESQFIQEINWYYEEVSENKNLEAILEVTKNLLKNPLIKYSNLELDYIKNFLENYKISPSDLNTFLQNPLEFLHKVVFKYPFEWNKYTIFWNVYHRVLELFYLEYKRTWILPDKSFLIDEFKKRICKEILTSEELEEALEKWVTWLGGYYDEYSKKWEIPLELEYNFRWRNLVFENIPITWKIDKIEISSTNNFWQWLEENIQKWWQLAFFKDKVSLVDYKTWSIKTLWKIKWIDREWNKKDEEGSGNYFRQLLFYKLLCESDFEFNSKFDISSLAIDFVEWKDGIYKFVEVEYTPEEYEEFKEELRTSREKINDLEFWKEMLKNS